MKYLICTLFVTIMFTLSHAQTNALLGQYFQNMPAYSPAQVGMHDYLDINFGFRQQWAGFNGAPQAIYLSSYGVIRSKDVRLGQGSSEKSDSSEPSFQLTKQAPTVKHGVGGYILSDEQGPYKQSETSFAYAVHIPVSRETYLSMGVAPSLYFKKIDLSDVWVKDQLNDQAYQSLLQNGSSNTFLHMNIGLSMYSRKYYISYSMMEAADLHLSGNKEVNDDTTPIRHHILGGYRFFLRNNVELIPNAFVRIDRSKPAFFELGTRARYNQNLWAGMSYRNDKTLVGMFGLTLNNKWEFGYAYEYKTADISRYSSGTHELILGIQLFNRTQHASMW